MSFDRRHFLKSVGASAAAAVLILAPLAAAGERATSAISFDRGRSDFPKVALTFDGGSDAGDADLILTVLEQRGVRATFFLTGDFLRQFPDIARRIAAGGHEVGNHTWSHPHLTAWEQTGRHETLPWIDRTGLQRELSRTASEYERITGRALAPLWRAPFGEVNDEIASWAAEGGWAHVGWSRDARGRQTLDSLDWVADRSSRHYLPSARMVQRILSFDAGGNGLSGGIVLMHLCARREDRLATRLDVLIDSLRARGYVFATVGGLQRDLAAPGATVVLAAR
jgi:peptidoglycan/xylan/chitin deacetylase (PgdA/CDA1 family)